MMWRRLLSLSLLLSVTVGYGGLGRVLHDHESEARAGEQQSPGHPVHDHDHCAVCQQLAAPRIDRLPGTSDLIGLADPPLPTRAVSQSTPHFVFVHTSVDARGPPHAPHA